MDNDGFRSLLEMVVLRWRQSTEAYARYMENGKTFRFAEVLKLHNTAVKNLLTDNMASIPDDVKEDAAAVIEHYIIWSAKWDALKGKMNPGPDDEFVFENDHRFPKEAAKRMEAILGSLS